MKTAILATLIAAAALGQSALAGELSCTVTRENLFNSSDIATHTYVHEFDESDQYGSTIVSGIVDSFLIPSTAQVDYSFVVVGKGKTRLRVQTFSTSTWKMVNCRESYGSYAAPPQDVEVTFKTKRHEYTVSCYIL